MVNDVLFRGHVVGVETRHIWFPNADASQLSTRDVTINGIMATTGFTEGPVSAVDVVLRVSGGAAQVVVGAVEPGDGDGEDISSHFAAQGFEGFVPLVGASVEFGVGVAGPLRISAVFSWLGALESNTVYSFLSMGIGIGGRF